MPAEIDITGHRFGTLVAVKRMPSVNGRLSEKWLCSCDCGNLPVVYMGNLRNGNSTSCGCVHALRLREAVTRHGLRHSDEYRIWVGIKTRCYNRQNHSFARYGARGIGMSPEWREDFMAFYSDMGPRPSKSHSVERIDNDGDYTKSNCIWATSTTQSRNKRTNIRYTWGDKTLTLDEWCRIHNRKYLTVWKRLDRGWSIGKALTVPAEPYSPR